MRSAVINDTTFIVENICVADAVTPSPYTGTIMVALQDNVYETQTTSQTNTLPAGTTISVNQDGEIILTSPDGFQQSYPSGTAVTTNADGTVTVTTYTSVQVLVSPATPCDIGWVYDPATQTFSAPQG